MTKPPATNPPTPTKIVEKRFVVLFDCFRYSVKGLFRKVVTYDHTHDNVESAMNLFSGIFTAPSQGVYLFETTALPGLDLQVNGNGVPWGYQPAIEDENVRSNARISLNAGDRVNLYNSLDVDPIKFRNWRVLFQGSREE